MYQTQQFVNSYLLQSNISIGIEYKQKMELIFASANKGKIKEIHEIIGKSFTIKGLNDIGITEEIPETGHSFYENAYLKANYVYQKTSLPCFADDSGLEIEALNGRPSIHSAYYAGLPRNDNHNIQKVLNEMAQHTNRKARFVCVICLIIQGKVQYFQGVLNGHIATQSVGNNGFGYDPIFIPEGYTHTLAEIPLSVKNTISHRYKAIIQMKKYLDTLLYHAK